MPTSVCAILFNRCIEECGYVVTDLIIHSFGKELLLISSSLAWCFWWPGWHYCHTIVWSWWPRKVSHSVLNRCRANCCQTQHRPRLWYAVSRHWGSSEGWCSHILLCWWNAPDISIHTQKFVIAFRKLLPVLPGEASRLCSSRAFSTSSAEILYAVIRSGFSHTHGIFPVTQDISHAHAIHAFQLRQHIDVGEIEQEFFHPGPDRCCTGSHTWACWILRGLSSRLPAQQWGSLLMTEATWFWILTEAMLGSTPELNTTCIEASPSLPASEAMYLIPGTPLMALSSGITTALTISSPLAPGYPPWYWPLGGEIEGNCVTGNWTSATKPNRVMMSDITIDSTGLCMNLLNMKCCLRYWNHYCLMSWRLEMTFSGSIYLYWILSSSFTFCTPSSNILSSFRKTGIHHIDIGQPLFNNDVPRTDSIILVHHKYILLILYFIRCLWGMINAWLSLTVICTLPVSPCFQQ